MERIDRQFRDRRRYELLILSDDSMQQAAEVIQTYFMDMLGREIDIVSGEEP